MARSTQRVAQLVVRQLEERLKERLRERARRHGRSLEAEIREILRSAVSHEPRDASRLGERIAARFAGIGLRADLPEMRGESPRGTGFGK